MRRTRLDHQLLRIGFATGSKAHGSRIRFTGLVAAAAVLTAMLLSVLAVLATYDGRAERDCARGWTLSNRQPGRRW